MDELKEVINKDELRLLIKYDVGFSKELLEKEKKIKLEELNLDKKKQLLKISIDDF